jgi:hypothetical protein
MVRGYITSWWTLCDNSIEREDTKRYVGYLLGEIIGVAVQFHCFYSLCIPYRCWAQIFTICNFGKLLDMLQTTRRICSFLRWAHSQLTQQNHKCQISFYIFIDNWIINFLLVSCWIDSSDWETGIWTEANELPWPLSNV